MVPTVQAVLRQVGWSVKSLDAVAVALGPGSFTGLRIGLATARTLAFAVGAKLFGVNTLQVIAVNACLAGDFGQTEKPHSGRLITAAVDAQRGEVSAQTFWLTPSRHFAGDFYPEPIDERRLLSVSAWWAMANDAALDYTGPILFKTAGAKPESVRLLDESLWLPRAVGVSRIAWERLLSGESDDLMTMQPYYSRRSAAEEKKQGAGGEKFQESCHSSPPTPHD